jgi:hypothetical protein
MTLRIFALFAILLTITPTMAEDKISTRLGTSTEDGETSAGLFFAYASCEDECHIATFSCSASGAVTIELADVDAKHAAAAIIKEARQIIISAGSRSFDYFIQEMQYQEMTGSWWLTAHTQDVKARDLAPAIGAVKSITALVGKQKLVLPVDANAKLWAEACK